MQFYVAQYFKKKIFFDLFELNKLYFQVGSFANLNITLNILNQMNQLFV